MASLMVSHLIPVNSFDAHDIGYLFFFFLTLSRGYAIWSDIVSFNKFLNIFKIICNVYHLIWDVKSCNLCIILSLFHWDWKNFWHLFRSEFCSPFLIKVELIPGDRASMSAHSL